MTNKQLRRLPANNLSPKQLKALPTTALSSLSPSQFKQLNRKQINALPNALWDTLNRRQRNALGRSARSAASVQRRPIHPPDVPAVIDETRNPWLAGDDTLIGGSGADRFVLSTGNDTITDFNPEQGDQLAIDPALTLSFQQDGDHLLLLDDTHSIQTTLRNTTLDQLLTAQPEFA